MRKLLIITLFVTAWSCSNNKIDVDELISQPEQKGSLAISVDFVDDLNSITGRTDIPECSGGWQYLQLTILDSEGAESSHELDIQIQDFVDVPLVLPVGEYTLIDAYLKSTNLVTTYAAPNSENPDPRYDFHELVENPLPIDFSIVADQKTIVQTGMMCHTQLAVPDAVVDSEVAVDLNVQKARSLLLANNEHGKNLFIKAAEGREFSPAKPLTENYREIHPVLSHQSGTGVNLEGLELRTETDAYVYSTIVFNRESFIKTIFNVNGDIASTETIDYTIGSNSHISIDGDSEFTAADAILLD